jgi:hypothetical protein
MFTLLGLSCSCSTHALLVLLMLYCGRGLTCSVSGRREISLVTHLCLDISGYTSLLTQENLSDSTDMLRHNTMPLLALLPQRASLCLAVPHTPLTHYTFFPGCKWRAVIRYSSSELNPGRRFLCLTGASVRGPRASL